MISRLSLYLATNACISGKSSVVPYNLQVPKESLCLYLSVVSVSRGDGCCLRCGIDSDDPLVGDERLDEANRFPVVIFIDDHSVPPRILYEQEFF